MHRRVLRRRLGVLLQDAVEQRGVVVSTEGTLSREHLVEYHAERVHVRRRRQVAPRDLLGRHVRRRACDDGGRVVRLPLDPHREAEIEDSTAPLTIHHDVARLEIAVNDSDLVRRSNRARDVRGNAHSARRSELTVFENDGEVRAVHEFHRVIGEAVERLAHVVDRHDAGIVHPRCESRFGPERSGIRLVRADIEVFGANLERHRPVEAMLEGLPHHAHPTAPEHTNEVVSRHRWAILRRDRPGTRHRPRGVAFHDCALVRHESGAISLSSFASRIRSMKTYIFLRSWRARGSTEELPSSTR